MRHIHTLAHKQLSVWIQLISNPLSFVVILSYGDYGATGGKSPLMKTLMDAEAAANSAAVQLMSFKEILEDDFAVM